ncbi:hypothetical protein [Ruminococcus sp.]|uniref:hypothetical protein n=1 Tax=Ruminococcus sp. TaxID=41978 RepID=UPI0025CC190B|nr:hypothetical protein [Ruminococcus sp.]MBQ8965977.1 hypothetical protein [Ruminococcus sp.]
MKKEIRLYNMIFPIWLLMFFPWVCFPAAALNFGIDSLVLLLTMKKLGLAPKKPLWKKSIIRVVIFGFIGDIVGALCMLTADTVLYHTGGHEADHSLMYDPWRNPLALVTALFCMAVASLVIFILDRSFAFNKTDLTPEHKKKLALSMAVFTTPILFIVPTRWFGIY